jgi:hypothetical protein
MSTPAKERAINVDQDRSPTSRGQSPDQVGKPTKFIFDVALSTAIEANGQTHTKVPNPKGPLTPDMLDKMNRYWRAANYLCIGQISLFENSLLREPLKAEQIKPRLLGHWGTSPGQNLIYIHLGTQPSRTARPEFDARGRGAWLLACICRRSGTGDGQLISTSRALLHRWPRYILAQTCSAIAKQEEPDEAETEVKINPSVPKGKGEPTQTSARSDSSEM